MKKIQRFIYYRASEILSGPSSERSAAVEITQEFPDLILVHFNFLLVARTVGLLTNYCFISFFSETLESRSCYLGSSVEQ